MSDLHRLVERAGANEAVFRDPAFPDRPVTVYSARPRHFDATTPVLFVHHGRGRNGRDYRDYLLDEVDEHGVLVIAPEFSNESFPGQPWYNSGNVRDESGVLNSPAARSYGAIEHLFITLRDNGVTSRRRYAQFGHSAGAQFVHRMMMFGFRHAVAGAVSANAGTYMMPDFGIDFPYGWGGVGLTEDDLTAMLRFRLTIMAGTADNNPDEEHFPRDPGSMRQGGTRYERAHRFIAAGRTAAAERGVPCGWTIIDVPDVAHDGRRMEQAAAPILAAALHASEFPDNV
jgi:poly(3-hydroxybutyrate) depolymerase